MQSQGLVEDETARPGKEALVALLPATGQRFVLESLSCCIVHFAQCILVYAPWQQYWRHKRLPDSKSLGPYIERQRTPPRPPEGRLRRAPYPFSA